MSYSCPICEKTFGRKDNMQRHVNNRHSNPDHFTPFNAMPYSAVKCERFQFEHPFTCMVVGMTGSGKTVWVQSLLKQANRMINPPPERSVWCYSQWQPAYMESQHTKHRICQGHPAGSGTRFLLGCEQTEFNGV